MKSETLKTSRNEIVQRSKSSMHLYISLNRLRLNHFSNIVHPVVKLVLIFASENEPSFSVEPVKLTFAPRLRGVDVVESVLWKFSSEVFSD